MCTLIPNATACAFSSDKKELTFAKMLALLAKFWRNFENVANLPNQIQAMAGTAWPHEEIAAQLHSSHPPRGHARPAPALPAVAVSFKLLPTAFHLQKAKNN